MFYNKKRSKETVCQAFYRLVEFFSNEKRSEGTEGRLRGKMELQSWRNFVVIQQCDRDKLGTIHLFTYIHFLRSIAVPINLERKNIIFPFLLFLVDKAYNKGRQEEEGLKQVSLNVTTRCQIANTLTYVFNKFIGLEVKNFYLLKGVKRFFRVHSFHRILVDPNSFEKAENYWPPATCLRDKSSNKRSRGETKSSNSRDTTRHWLVNSMYIPRALTYRNPYDIATKSIFPNFENNSIDPSFLLLHTY